LHVFVDESERQNRYLMCAVHVAPPHVHIVRPALIAMRMRGQQRVHMTKERPSRRRLIPDRIAALPLRAVVYVCSAPPTEARPAILRRLAVDLVEQGASRLVIEPVESCMGHDRVVIFNALEKHRPRSELVYEHVAARLEPVLWAADAIAWAHGTGGDWRRRIGAIVEEVVVDP
jgi:hypothetical protein